jgi:hypothetical protein
MEFIPARKGFNPPEADKCRLNSNFGPITKSRKIKSESQKHESTKTRKKGANNG